MRVFGLLLISNHFPIVISFTKNKMSVSSKGVVTLLNPAVTDFLWSKWCEKRDEHRAALIQRGQMDSVCTREPC